MTDESLEYFNSFADADSLAEALRTSCENIEEPKLQPLIARAIVGEGMNSQLLKAMLPPPPKKGGKGPKTPRGPKTKPSGKKGGK
ncbi:MAG: hypothetical protein J0G28_07770 [Afipia sp.]|nr:hypothetical protein [Afipia sp.]OJW65805.1 MAG: hypothetical protein BGO65_07710 [Afipia sp. 64-13]